MTRLIVLMLLLLVVQASHASARCAEELAADTCSRQIAVAVIELKYEPGCISTEHKPATTYFPCTSFCLEDVCHQPLMTYSPCGAFCIEDVCHKPLSPVHICGFCLAEITLTGCRCQIECRDCSSSCSCS